MVIFQALSDGLQSRAVEPSENDRECLEKPDDWLELLVLNVSELLNGHFITTNGDCCECLF